MNAAVAPNPVTPMPQTTYLNLLIVDEDHSLRNAAIDVSRSLGFSTFIADNAEQGGRLIGSANIDAILFDIHTANGHGLEDLHNMLRQRPDAAVVVVSSFATVHAAVQAMKLGAYDYIPKPFSLQELRQILEQLAGHLRSKTESRLLRESLRTTQGFGNIVGRSPEMEKLYRIVAKAAQSTHPVLILGESGTGKEMVAKAIHLAGPLHGKPFIPVDCGSLVPTLIESELFGYVKGAFTGANQSKDGLMAMAEGGTIFLDEVGELPVDLQAKMLRAIQEKEIRPVGSTRRVPINIRILAATNRDLEQAVMQGTFRRDLYFRLNVLSLRIPALRERRQDIALLIGYFLERMTRTSGQEKVLSDQALKALLAYDWPGNVRELENCLERSYAFTSGPTIQVADLPPEIAHLPHSDSSDGNGNSHLRIVPIAELEKQTILKTITELNGDKLQAARLLGIGKTTLYRKLKDYAAQGY